MVTMWPSESAPSRFDLHDDEAGESARVIFGDQCDRLCLSEQVVHLRQGIRDPLAETDLVQRMEAAEVFELRGT